MKKAIRDILVFAARRLLGVLREAQSQDVKRQLGGCGENVQLHEHVCIAGAESVILGDKVSVGPFAHFWGQGQIRVGHRVMIGSHVAITSMTHDYRVERMQDTLIKKAVLIEDDVWIGAHAVIMPGITIGKGAVVAAGAVVTSDVESYAIVAGVPARRLKFRVPSPKE